jgi:hypothetical protein
MLTPKGVTLTCFDSRLQGSLCGGLSNSGNDVGELPDRRVAFDIAGAYLDGTRQVLRVLRDDDHGRAAREKIPTLPHVSELSILGSNVVTSDPSKSPQARSTLQKSRRIFFGDIFLENRVRLRQKNSIQIERLFSDSGQQIFNA